VTNTDLNTRLAAIEAERLQDELDLLRHQVAQLSTQPPASAVPEHEQAKGPPGPGPTWSRRPPGRAGTS